MSDTTSPPSNSDAVTTGTVEPVDGAAGARRLYVRRSRRRWLLVPVVVVAGVAVAVLAQRVMAPHLYSGTVLQAPEPAPSTAGLVYADGTPFDASAATGEVTVLFFGYTNCPDVCPTTLSVLRRAVDDLGDDAGRVNVVFVSIDPERDTAEIAQAYASSFDPTFRGVSGRPDDVRRVASLYGVYSAAGAPDAAGTYAVDHTATMMGIDTSGHLRLVWPPDVTAEQLTADLDALVS